MLSKQQSKNIIALQQKKVRRNEELFLVEGEKTVEDLLLSDWSIRMICITDSISQNLKDLIGRKYSGELIEVSSEEMDRISPQTAPQGVLAIVHQKESRFDISEFKDQLVIVLDDIQDPGNLGTIIRIADWFGVRHIVCSMKTAECYNPKVVQASMGSLFRTTIHYMDLAELFQLNVETINLPVFGTLMKGENLFTSELNENAFLIMGNESIGISDSVQSFIGRPLNIPSFAADAKKGPDSLNVAIATGIVCAEFRRRVFR